MDGRTNNRLASELQKTLYQVGKVHLDVPGIPSSDLLSLVDERGFGIASKQVVAGYVDHYNKVRLHSAIGYVPPSTVLEGRRDAIHEQQDKKLVQARLNRIKLSNNKNFQDSIAA